jgi:hypothetical protein
MFSKILRELLRIYIIIFKKSPLPPFKKGGKRCIPELPFRKVGRGGYSHTAKEAENEKDDIGLLRFISGNHLSF